MRGNRENLRKTAVERYFSKSIRHRHLRYISADMKSRIIQAKAYLQGLGIFCGAQNTVGHLKKLS